MVRIGRRLFNKILPDADIPALGQSVKELNPWLVDRTVVPRLGVVIRYPHQEVLIRHDVAPVDQPGSDGRSGSGKGHSGTKAD